MKKLLQVVLMSVMALFASQTLLAQESEGIKVNAQSAEVSVQGFMDYTSDKIVDGLYSTKFESLNGQEVGTTATVTLAEETQLDNIKLYFGNNLYSYCPNKIKLQVSTDKQTWTDVAGSEINVITTAEYDTSSGLNVVTINAAGYSAKYVRMVLLETGNSWLVIYEFEVYKSPKVEARTISVSVNDSTMGSAYIGTEGTSEVADETGPVTIVAVPKDGYKFINWTVEGQEVSTNASYTDLTAGDKEFVANYRELASFNVSVSSSNEEFGTATASETGEVLEDTEVIFTATPTADNKFVNWTVDGTIVSLENPYTATVTKDMNLVANFTD